VSEANISVPPRASRSRTTSWTSALAALGIALAVVVSRPLAGWLIEGIHPPWLELIVSVPLIIGVPVGLFTLGVRWSERHGLSPGRGLVAACALAAIAGAVLYAALDLPEHLREPGDPHREGLAATAFLGAYNNLLCVGIWALVYHMPAAARAEREREREHAELWRAVEQARLRATLEPHFVLNTLNAIAGLVHEDPDEARERIGDLGDLLRDVVRLSDTSLHPLDDEVRWLERYTRILVARHHGRLEVSWDIEPESRGAAVPVLVLQPLVENAIQHGALQRPDGGRIAIATRVTGRRLSCTIADNGPGFAAEVRPGAQGLALTRRRLDAEWPGATLTVDSGAAGTRVEIAWLRGSA
jgi:signal transduction histidine kinase